MLMRVVDAMMMMVAVAAALANNLATYCLSLTSVELAQQVLYRTKRKFPETIYLGIDCSTCNNL